MSDQLQRCPECEAGFDRRDFLRAVGVTTAGAALPLWATPRTNAAPSPQSAAETAVKALFETLTDTQKKTICFPWDHQQPGRGLLRTFVSNNWQITKPTIRSPFYTKKQQDL